LVGGVDVDKDDGFRIVIGDDGLVKELPELRFVEAAEQITERGVEGESGAIGFAERELKSEDGREGLHLDETGSELAGGFADEAEVGGEEVWVRVLVGGAPLFGDGREGTREVGGVVDELEGEVVADLGDFVEERLRKEARCFRDGKRDVGARDGVEGMEQVAEGFRAEARVEVLAEGGDHENRVQGAGYRVQRARSHPPDAAGSLELGAGSSEWGVSMMGGSRELGDGIRYEEQQTRFCEAVGIGGGELLAARGGWCIGGRAGCGGGD